MPDIEHPTVLKAAQALLGRVRDWWLRRELDWLAPLEAERFGAELGSDGSRACAR